jgi:hypothetical protein
VTDHREVLLGWLHMLYHATHPHLYIPSRSDRKGCRFCHEFGLAASVPVKTSTFRNALSVLKGQGYIDVAGDFVTITDDGRANVPSGGIDHESVVAMWRSKFGGATLRMLDLLLDRPEGMTREELATAADVDVTTSTFRNSLSLLRGSGAVRAGRDGFVQVDEALTQ